MVKKLTSEEKEKLKAWRNRKKAEYEQERAEIRKQERENNEKQRQRQEALCKEDNEKALIKITLIQNLIALLYTIPRCSNCNDKHYFFLEFNSDVTGIRLQCSTCRSKKWLKIKNEAKDLISSPTFISDPDNKFYGESPQKIITLTYESLQNLNTKYTTIHLTANEDEEETEDEETDTKPQRHSISQDVKDKVWNRDGGKCVECDSNENLEFDHIIPVSKGGANTYRNLQLLCEPCNRSKSAKIG